MDRIHPQRLRKALIIFMRYPEQGKVKQRLASAIGHTEAARIYQTLVRRTLGVAADFRRTAGEVDIFIFLTPPERLPDARRRYPGPWTFFPQAGSHLGERMKLAMDCVAAMGYGGVSLVGSDIADLRESDFREAFEALDDGIAPLGPTEDGGFYLIGLNRPCPAAFNTSQWGTDVVFPRTEKALRASGFQVRTLARRRDVDRLEDVNPLLRDTVLQARLSVVIPMLSPPTPSNLLLQSLADQLWPDDEVIVVLPDEVTPEEASGASFGCTRTLTAPRGRGSQLNRGAYAAVGNVLLFLHGDSTPPPNFSYSVRKISQAPGTALGCFHLSFSPSTPALGAIAAWANFRTRRLKLPYGDQGLFCTRTVYEAIGGFHKNFLMEDVDFVRRCRAAGRLMVLPDAVVTSPRRYLAKGILRAAAENHILFLAYLLGMDERRLHSLYYR